MFQIEEEEAPTLNFLTLEQVLLLLWHQEFFKRSLHCSIYSDEWKHSRHSKASWSENVGEDLGLHFSVQSQDQVVFEETTSKRVRSSTVSQKGTVWYYFGWYHTSRSIHLILGKPCFFWGFCTWNMLIYFKCSWIRWYFVRLIVLRKANIPATVCMSRTDCSTKTKSEQRCFQELLMPLQLCSLSLESTDGNG